MNCFNHRSVPAIGLCKSCGKGLCADCATELVSGLACKASCKTAVDEHNRQVQNILSRILELEKHISRTSRNHLRSSGVITMIMGFGLLIFALWAHYEMGTFFPYFFYLFGLATLAMGFLRLRLRREYVSANVDED